MMILRISILALGLSLAGSVARAGVAPDYDFQWATIGDVGNPAWTGSFLSPVYNHGRVDYEYRISKLEVTSAQWLEFVNTIGPVDSDFVAQHLQPSFWGAVQDFDYPDGYRFRYREPYETPTPELVPINGITWRAAAMYCNWLHNDKAPALWALQSGAYDTSTFGFDPDTGDLTDQHTRSPGAKFWIPSMDEWTKAAHWDPHKFGPDQGGYWVYPTTSDTAPMPGRPGEPGAQTSATLLPIGDYDLPQYIPLGAYPEVTSPWGLLDTSGGASEYTEYWAYDSRLLRGSSAGGPEHLDRISVFSSAVAFAPWGTLRVASMIPAPYGVSLFVAGLVHFINRRRKTCGEMERSGRSSSEQHRAELLQALANELTTDGSGD